MAIKNEVEFKLGTSVAGRGPVNAARVKGPDEATVNAWIQAAVDKIAAAGAIGNVGGEWGDVKTVLAWLYGNENTMVADSIVRGIIAGDQSIYIDTRIGGKPVENGWTNGRTTRTMALAALRHLKTAMVARASRGPTNRSRVAAATPIPDAVYVRGDAPPIHVGYLRSALQFSLADVVWVPAGVVAFCGRQLRQNAVHVVWDVGSSRDIGTAHTLAEARKVLGEAKQGENRKHASMSLSRSSPQGTKLRHEPGAALTYPTNKSHT